jgi:glycine/D-amino acid oxidase-like deaminating enzyme
MHGTGPHGIMPVRGQVVALLVPQHTSPSRGNQAVSWVAPREYWFARKSEPENARTLVILGGARSEPPFEAYSSDDSELNTDVGRKLREFLPETFLDLKEEDLEVEWEWVS